MTGEVATRAPAAGRADVDRAVEAAAAAFPGWAATGPNARRAILLKAADALDARTPEFIATAMAETGATGPWIGFNVFLAASMLREAAAMTTQIAGEVIPSDKPGTLAMALREPVGVLVGMAPWNAPVILGVRAMAMPLACGNTVVFKASEMCPGTHRLIVETLNAAGLPKGVLNIITHSAEDAPEVVSALIAHPKVRRINFTGSTRVGRIIAEQAGRHLKPVLLELGGKAPLVILDDADLDGAVNAAAFGAFMNQGQICMSTEKIIVDAKVADDFVERFAAKAAALPFGDPSGHVVLGSVVSRAAVERVAALIDDAVGQGRQARHRRRHRHARSCRRPWWTGSPPRCGSTPRNSSAPWSRWCASTASSRRSPRPTTATTASPPPSSAATSTGRSRWRGGSSRASSTSTARPCRTRRRCPSAASRASGYGRFGGKAGIDAFTELRWVTIEDAGQHYPF